MQVSSANNPIRTIECFPRSFSEKSLDMPLATRGWALQERLLSPRTLFLTASQLFWQCSSMEVCEVLPTNRLGSTLCYGGRKAISIASWNRIVQWYSKCSLTCSRDKLVAVAGIARMIHQQTNEQYIAGLWRKSIEFQICWFLYRPGAKAASYRAPSWSWASIDGHIYYMTLMHAELHNDIKIGYRSLIRVYQANVTHLTLNDPFGEVSAATLQIGCGNLLEGTMAIIDNWEATFSSTTFPGYKEEIRAYLDYDDSGLVGEDVEIFLLPVTSYNITAPTHEGLLLRATGRGKGEYERFGWWKTQTRGPDTVGSFQELLERDAAAPPNLERFAAIHTVDDGSLQKVIMLV